MHDRNWVGLTEKKQRDKKEKALQKEGESISKIKNKNLKNGSTKKEAEKGTP